MLERTGKIFSISPIVEQVSQLEFGERLSLNEPTGSFFSEPWKTFDHIKNTPLGNLLDNLNEIGEARLMKLSSAGCYTGHSDPDDRYQLSIITNDYSYLIDLETSRLYHLPTDGVLWRMDTSKIHSAVNFGGRDRIHLNIRLLLPKFCDSMPHCRIVIEGGDYDWKFESYKILMPFINLSIKKNVITGFERISDRELLINIDDRSLLLSVIQRLETKGFKVFVY